MGGEARRTATPGGGRADEAGARVFGVLRMVSASCKLV